MQWKSMYGGVALVVLCAAGTASAETPSKKTAVERGEYLSKIGGCNDCHTPWIMENEKPKPDMSRMLSGHPADMELPSPPEPKGPWVWMGAATNTAFAGPWGISYATNLTPHATGMKEWTEAEFIGAMRTGKHRGKGRPILPPMPWFAIAEATDEDLKAIWAYLKSIPAMDNAVPAPQPPGSE